VPVVACPKCPAQLKIPDGVSGNTKCPKCGTVFPVVARPAFEVVDDAPRPAAKAPADEEPEFEVVEDDDEPPRKKRKPKRDEDDEDFEVEIVVYDEDGNEIMRSRERGRSRDDDDEDEDERPRKKKKAKKKRRRYDDDEGYWQPGPRGGGGFGNGRTGALLMGISFWLNLGAYGLIALISLGLWLMLLSATGADTGLRVRGSRSDGSFSEFAIVLPGLVGLGAWIVGTIGSSFAIGGPQRARGMAITATVFAGLHLVLLGVTFSNMHGGATVARGLGVGSPAWLFVASALPALDSLLPMMIYSSRAASDGDYLVALLAAVCELLRLIFMLLAIKKTAEAARDGYAAEKAQFGLTMVAMVAGGVAAFALLMVTLLAEGAFKSFETIAHLTIFTVLVVYLGYAFMMLNPALAALQTKDACARR
jgi:hypothetical protein